MHDDTAQTINLRDGRTLGYAEWGAKTGTPVLYFGGSGSSRLARHPDETVLTEHDIRLFTFDRPGMGLSSRQKGRSLLDWADDIRDFAEQIGLTQFAIVAASQGGPYGVACAYALSDLFTQVALVSAVAGLEDESVMATQSMAMRGQIAMSRRAPWLLALQYTLIRPLLDGQRAEKIVRSILGNLPESDQAIMTAPEMLTMLTDDVREGVRQGGGGAVDDMRAVTQPWGFKLEAIQADVHIWQGMDDPNVTPAMAHYLAERIPHSNTHFVDGAGHLLIYSHWQPILAQASKKSP